MGLPLLQQGTCVAQLPDDLLVVDVLPSPFELAVLSSRLQDQERARQIMQRFAAEAAATTPRTPRTQDVPSTPSGATALNDTPTPLAAAVG